MAIHLFSRGKARKNPAPHQEVTSGCTAEGAAILRAFAASLTNRSASDGATAALHRAIASARGNLPDPCEDGRLLTHLDGMTALLSLVHARASLLPQTAKLLPERDPFERSIALTAERAFRRTTMVLEGLKKAAQQGEPKALSRLGTVLDNLNRITRATLTLRDEATTFISFSASVNVGSHAAKEALAIATLLGRPDTALPFVPLTADDIRTVWQNIAPDEDLNMLVSTIKVRQLQDNGAPAPSLRTLLTSRGHTYRLQPPLTDRAGAHGRVFTARADEAPHQPLIVKVQRTQRKLVGRQATLDAPLQQLLQSAATSKAAITRIDAALEAHATLFEGSHAILRDLDARSATTAVVDQFVAVSGKFYQVMRAMAGDLADVSRTLSAQVDADPAREPLVAQARLSVAVQTALQLQGLHERRRLTDGGIAHLDIKLPNVVFNEEGLVRLIDFDEARVTSPLGHVRSGSYSGGSLSSPERDSQAFQRKGGALSKPYDVWCWGAAMLELGSPTFQDATGSGPRAVHVILDKPADGPRSFGVGEWFSVYKTMWQRHIQGAGTLAEFPSVPSVKERDQAIATLKAQSDAAKQLPQSTLESYVDACYARLSRFIRGRLQSDPELTLVLLQQALAPEPKRRSSAKKLTATLVHMMARQTEQERTDVRRLFASLAHKTPLTEVR